MLVDSGTAAEKSGRETQEARRKTRQTGAGTRTTAAKPGKRSVKSKNRVPTGPRTGF